MSARIPHLLTRLLTSDELDSLKAEMLTESHHTTGPASLAWLDAALLVDKHRDASVQRRTDQTPSARRKSLGLRYTR